MKKVLFKIMPAMVIILAFGLLLFSCTKKDPVYDVAILVKYKSDTTKVVKGAEVTIEKNAVQVKGLTDAGGMFYATFQYEAILDVRATIDTGSPTSPALMYGNSTIRLIADKTVHRTVFVSP